jgi:IS30 family transposase
MDDHDGSGSSGAAKRGRGRPRISDEVLKPVVDAVLGGLSVAEAAELACVSAPTIRSRLPEGFRHSNSGRHVPDELVQTAIDAVMKGMSPQRAAKLAGIHVRTLRSRLLPGGRMPGRRGRRRGVVISKEALQSALDAVACGMGIERAAASAGIPVHALQSRVKQFELMKPERKRRPGSLTEAEREEIRVGIVSGLCDAEIARRIKRHRGTVGREIAANGGRTVYRACDADRRARELALRPKEPFTVTRPWLWEEIQDRLKQKKWSPEQISGRFHLEHPDQPQWWVSHETIYRAIFVQTKGELRKELTKCLRTGRVRRRHRRSTGAPSPGAIRGMVNISERPAEADDRAVPGHWEGDLIMGKNNASAVATLVERTTQMGMFIKVESKSAAHVAERLAERVSQLPAQLVRSLTWDQGRELADHESFKVKTGVQVYFCDPHSPWQRPTNENWNGLARQFFPKGTDLSIYSQEELDVKGVLINGRPRKTLGWETPAERFNKLVAETT